MMYNNKLICIVKDSNKKNLREYGDTVYIPFTEEYSLSLKDLESRKAVVSIKIDGVDVLGGQQMVLYPGIETSLERFMLDGNLNKGNKFKFIKKTQEISDFRGDRIDDGIIEIKFQFEKEKPITITSYFGPPISYKIWDSSEFYSQPDLKYCFDDTIPKKNNGMTFGCIGNIQTYSASCVDSNLNRSVESEDGITVKGSISNQGFSYTSVDELESTIYTMVIRLKGKTEITEISKPINSNTRIQCPTCGRVYKTNFKFCPNCGTSLL